MEVGVHVRVNGDDPRPVSEVLEELKDGPKKQLRGEERNGVGNRGGVGAWLPDGKISTARVISVVPKLTGSATTTWK